MATASLGVGTASTSNRTSYDSGSFTPAAGDLLVVFVIATATAAVGSMTNSGTNLGWSIAATATKRTNADKLWMFVADAKVASATATTVTFSCSGDAATGAVITVVRIAGMSRVGLDAIKQSTTEINQASAIPTLTFATAALTSNVTLGFIGEATNPAGLTPPTLWTELSDTGYNNPTTGSQVVARNSGFDTTTITWGNTTGSVWGGIIAELDTSVAAITGTGEITLDTVVFSGSASQIHVATGAVSLANSTAAGVGTSTIQASGAVTLDTVAVAGSGSPVVQAFTGEFIGPAFFDQPINLDDVAVVASGFPVIVATGAVTLDAVACTGVVSDVVFGTGAITLDTVTASGTGSQTHVATGAVTLDTVTVAGSGDVGASSVVGTGAVTLDAVTVAGSGTSVVVGTGAVTLDAVTVAGTGSTVVVSSGAIALADATVAGAGSPVVAGTGAIALDSVACTGTVAAVVFGTGTITLADASVAGAGTQTHVASGAITLDTVSVAGDVAAVVFGSGVFTLADAVVATVPANSGTGAVTLDGIGIWATNKPAQLIGTVPAVLDIAGALPGFLGASGVVPATLAASGVIPAA